MFSKECTLDRDRRMESIMYVDSTPPSDKTTFLGEPLLKQRDTCSNERQ